MITPRIPPMPKSSIACLVILTGLFHRAVAEMPPNPPPTFSHAGLLPKQEIGALQFLKEHPTYDGRGVVVAIFDTGVDPGAVGLASTPDGQPKILDLIDGTGDGDVQLGDPVKPKDNTLAGLTGRTLKLDPKWTNPKATYRLGWKRGYDFFPPELVSQLKSAHNKEYLKQNAKIEEQLRRQLAKNQKSSEAKKDLETRLEQLQVIKNLDDPGPIYDCVVFHDGTNWRGVVDTDEDGDLRDEKLLTNFRLERQYASFPFPQRLNFSIDISNDGTRLSLVTPSGSHGTHVAGIVAAHLPRQPELNGIAPGAQIVSVKIGHSRLGGMETGPALMRGLRAVLDHKCNLVNMSFGEPTSYPNHGRLVDQFSEIVDQHGVIFVASAGNEGPALSTVGAPGGTTSSLLGIGAYVSPEMMAGAYTLRESLLGMPYTWSSRGPTTDGDLGVDLFAPGGAVAPVPNYTRTRNLRMNGTSMASPNACGAIALLLSGLKDKQIAYGPPRIARALKNTATLIEGQTRFAQGAGLIQVDQAFQYLIDHAKDLGEDVHIKVAADGDRGIYLREPAETEKPSQHSIRLQPVFHEKVSAKKRIEFEMRLSLRSTAPWVTVGSNLYLAGSGQSFEVGVDPTLLKPGAHYAEIQALDATRPDRGPIARVPITAIRGMEQNSSTISETATFEPGGIERRFLHVPEGATWADLSLKLVGDQPDPQRFLLHTVQLVDGASFEDFSHRKFLTLIPGHQTVQSIPVVGGRTLEVCLAQYWSSLGKSKAQWSITFHGIQSSEEHSTLSPSRPVARVDLSAMLQDEPIAPRATFTSSQTILTPKSKEIRPLSKHKDRLPNGRAIYELVMTYEFQQPKPGQVTIRYPWNDNLLYESPYGSQLAMLFDEGKRLVATEDVFPEPIKLGKGPHTLIVQFRHEDVSKLKELETKAVIIERPLSKSISLSFYPSRVEAMQNEHSIGSRILPKGETLSLYIASPTAAQLRQDPEGAMMLKGTMSFGRSNDLKFGQGKRPEGFPIAYMMGSVSKPAKNGKSASPKFSEALKDVVWQAKLDYLKSRAKLDSKKKFEKLSQDMLKERPDDLDVLIARLHFLDRAEHRKEHLDQVVKAADAVIDKIDPERLDQLYRPHTNPEDTGAARKQKVYAKEREELIDALYRKGRALGYMELPDVIAKHPIKDPAAHNKAFEENFAELGRWVDTTETDYVLLHIRRARRLGWYGEALKLLNKQIADLAPTYWYYKKRRDVFQKLKWNAAYERAARWLVIRFPKHYEAF